MKTFKKYSSATENRFLKLKSSNKANDMLLIFNFLVKIINLKTLF